MLSKYLNLSFVLFVQNWLSSHLNLHLHFYPVVKSSRSLHKEVPGKVGLVGLIYLYWCFTASQLCKYLSNNIQHGGSLQIKFSFISSDCRLSLWPCLFVEGKYSDLISPQLHSSTARPDNKLKTISRT